MYNTYCVDIAALVVPAPRLQLDLQWPALPKSKMVIGNLKNQSDFQQRLIMNGTK